jgi:hypothetical protein
MDNLGAVIITRRKPDISGLLPVARIADLWMKPGAVENEKDKEENDGERIAVIFV